MTSPYRYWTSAEEQILKIAYQEGGLPLAKERLPHRAKDAIKWKASTLLLCAGVPNGYIAAIDVFATRQGKNETDRLRVSQYLLTRAREDGVLREAPGTLIKYTVPIEWADRFVEEIEAEQEHIREHRDWLRTRDLAKLLNHSHRYITRAFNENLLLARQIYAHVDSVAIKYPVPHRVFEPRQAQAFAAILKRKMTCPQCKNEKTYVLRTRDLKDEIKRRRHCRKCGHRFFTTELPSKELTQALLARQIQSPHGERQGQDPV